MEQKYVLKEHFADNGEHSHWSLIDAKTGIAVWEEGDEDHEHAEIFNRYHSLKEKIGELGYNNFIHSKEVEEYRAWLRNDRYKHRLDWFEKRYPNGLYYEEEGVKYGVNLETKKFLAEADAAYKPDPAKAEQPFNRDENSVEGKAAIEFYEWLQRSSMAKAEVPINIKWRMFVDQLIVKQRNNQ